MFVFKLQLILCGYDKFGNLARYMAFSQCYFIPFIHKHDLVAPG